MEKRKAIIIGSGISGISVSRMLSNQFDVKILEKQAKIGGLIKCDRIDGNLFHRVGGHVFNSRNQKVLDWFWVNFDIDKEFIATKRNAKILLDSNLIGYPLENYLFQLKEDQIKIIVSELLDLHAKSKKDLSDYKNFKEFLVGNFGEYLYSLYFGPYNSKIWNTDIEKVPLEWLEGKLPMPKIDEVILSNILKKEESSMVHATFYYPKRDGSQFIIDKLSKGLTIEKSYVVSSINIRDDNGLLINGQESSDVIIYCGDVRQLSQVIEINDSVLKNALESVVDLQSNGTSNVLCETDENDLSWLYLPEEKFKAHRIIYTGNFSVTNNEGSTRKTCVVEFSGKQSKSDMLVELSLLPGNLKPLEFNYEPNSYIIQNQDTRAKIQNLKDQLKTYNIYLLGRFAEWEYHNMDKCIEGAMALTAELTESN